MRIQVLTVEMAEACDADDWGRVTEAETTRRPLIHELIESGFRDEAGEQGDEWLRWLIESDQDVMARGGEIRDAMQSARHKEELARVAMAAYRENEV
jgi:hypothetical protein